MDLAGERLPLATTPDRRKVAVSSGRRYVATIVLDGEDPLAMVPLVWGKVLATLRSDQIAIENQIAAVSDHDGMTIQLRQIPDVLRVARQRQFSWNYFLASARIEKSGLTGVTLIVTQPRYRGTWLREGPHGASALLLQVRGANEWEVLSLHDRLVGALVAKADDLGIAKRKDSGRAVFPHPIHAYSAEDSTSSNLSPSAVALLMSNLLSGGSDAPSDEHPWSSSIPVQHAPGLAAERGGGLGRPASKPTSPRPGPIASIRRGLRTHSTAVAIAIVASIVATVVAGFILAGFGIGV